MFHQVFQQEDSHVKHLRDTFYEVLNLRAVACKWMIGIVKRGKLIYFAYYCMAIGMLAIIYSFFK